MTNNKLEATMHGAPGAPDVTSWGFVGVVAAKLWNDEGMRRAYVETMVRQPTPGYVRVDDEHRVAASFGQLVHDVHTMLVDDLMPLGVCTEDCVILPCDEADASVVLIRAEITVKAVPDEE